MNRILFSIKRADQTSRALQRKLLEGFGITPARYDLLVAIATRTRFRDVCQHEIHSLLGLKRPTAHEMIVALEALGFIKRCYQHRRLIWVNLTGAAWDLMRRVRKNVIRTGALWLTLCTALGGVQGMLELERFTTHFRTGFQDPATLDYPIFPECRYGYTLKRWAIEISPRRETLRGPAFGFRPCPDDPRYCTFDRASLDPEPR